MWKKKVKGEHLNEKKPRFVILYKQGETKKLRRILSSKFQVVIKSTITIKQQLCHQKNPIPFSQQSGVVYYYQCADCPERSNEEREGEHQQACERMDTGRSATAKHLWRNNHKANWKSCKINDKAQDWRRQENLESYIIS